MSASLVGSEMCIRDRRQRQAHKQRQQRDHTDEEKDADGGGTVLLERPMRRSADNGRQIWTHRNIRIYKLVVPGTQTDVDAGRSTDTQMKRFAGTPHTIKDRLRSTGSKRN
eukprot:2128535-Alexandrium_andersonii.AAC.1